MKKLFKKAARLVLYSAVNAMVVMISVSAIHAVVCGMGGGDKMQ